MTKNPIIAQLNRIEQQRKAAKAPLSEMIQPATSSAPQRKVQRQWQAVMEAAGYKYVVVRSFDDYRDIVNSYLSQVPDTVLSCVREAAKGADDDGNSRRLKEILGKRLD